MVGARDAVIVRFAISVKPPFARRHPLLRPWLVLLMLLGGGVVITVWNGSLWRADLLLYDTGSSYGPAPDDIVIVAIDDASLAQIGRWPWRRAIHAALLDRLRSAGARAVGLDVVLTEADPIAPADDETLAAAMARGPRTVLPLIVDWQQPPRPLHEALPIPQLASAAAALAHTHLEIDRDGIARSTFLREGLGSPSRSHLALAVLETGHVAVPIPLPGARRPNVEPARGAWIRDFHVLIPFLGPPGHIRRVSYADVLRGVVPQTELRDKLVLVGATAQGLGDAYPTPTSGEGVAMPGVEITANLMTALERGRTISPLPRSWSLLLALLPLLAAFYGFLRLSPRASLLWVAALVLLTLGGSLAALRWGYVWWPPAAALTALILAYPLWSWRRLDATQSFLDAELAALESEPMPLLSPRRPIAAASMMSDVLQRRIDRVGAATTRLRHLRQLLSDTIAALPDAMLLVDNDGRVVLGNPRAAALFSAASADSLQGEPAGCYLATVLTDGSPSFATLAADAPRSIAFRHTDGRELMLRVVAFHNDVGFRAGTIVDIADVSDLKRAERERDDTIRFLSHDLRSPSSSLLALAALLRDPARAPAPHQAAHRIETLARKTLTLADGFIALARAHILEPRRFEPFDLRDALQDALDEIWETAQSKQITIDSELGATAAMVDGDRQMLARALANLIGNAVKYAPSDSVIRLAIDVRDQQCSVSVRDQGPGIPKEQQGRLFQRFQRGLHAGDEDPGGIGLGLEFVRVIAQKHGGSATVASASGLGATFTLHLPETAA